MSETPQDHERARAAFGECDDIDSGVRKVRCHEREAGPGWIPCVPCVNAKRCAAALAEQREQIAKIADKEAEAHRLRDDPQRMDACRYVAAAIRKGERDE